MSNAFKKCVEIWSVWDLWKATCNWYRQYCYIEYHTSCRWHKALHWAWMLNRGQVLWDCWYTASMRREIATVGWRGEQPRNLWYIRLSFGNLWKLQGRREAHLRPAYCELLNMNLVKWKKNLLNTSMSSIFSRDTLSASLHISSSLLERHAMPLPQSWVWYSK